MLLKYTGTSDVHLMSEDDWEQAGIKHDAVSWDASNNWTAEVTATAGKKLMGDGTFEDVTDEAAPKTESTSKKADSSTTKKSS